MENPTSESPELYASLDAFDLDGSPLADGSLAGDLVNGGLSSADAATTAATVASSVGEAGPVTTGGTPPAISSLSGSPSGIDAAHQQQPSFFQSDPSSWVYQETPPYDPSSLASSPYGPITPVHPHQQTWDLPVHFNPNQQQLMQQLPLYPPQQQQPPPASAAPGIDPSLATGVPAAGAPLPHAAFAPNGNLVVGQQHQYQQQQQQQQHQQLHLQQQQAQQQQQQQLDAQQHEAQRNIQNTLTPAQQERLKTIAMPPHLQYHSPKSAGSPDSSSSGHDKGAGSSPDPIELSKSSSRKRKSSAEVDDDDEDDDLEQPVKKTAHNMIEKRYRTNLNDKIAALRDSVPSLRIMSKSARGEDTTEDREELHGLTPAHKLNKATVLSKATEYIRHLEKRNNRLIEENNSMQARIAAFEKLFMAGALSNPMPNPMQQSPPMGYARDAAAFINTPMATPPGPDPPGMIPIPDSMKPILMTQQLNAGRPYPVPGHHFGQTPMLVRQQQIQQQVQQQAQAGRWNPNVGKLMVGSLAGLMLVEALLEKEASGETTDGRGLSMSPLTLLLSFVSSTHVTIGGHYISGVDILAKLKWFSIFASLIWVACGAFLDPSIFQKPEKPKGNTSSVRAVPSLASPIHVRRQAWLTAIQTVWVPRHNFLLEAAALTLKTLKYTLRNVVGINLFLTLTGVSEEQEEARIKAWSIALDAQLAGGDVEINKSRLTLTLIASGTLPDTPLRLMLKALHIRVLLCQGNVASLAAGLISAKLARSRWNEARQLNRMLNAGQTDDALPEHLAALLEQECDEVLNDEIIQRAYNLAWNRPTTEGVANKIDGMDTVVEDPAIRSPMDAVSAWYSTLILHRVLVASLNKSRKSSQADSDEDDKAAEVNFAEEISLAAKLAPIGSSTQVRALVARAVLVEEKRGMNIAAAIQAFGPALNPDKHPQIKEAVPPLIDSPMTSIMPDPDSQMALRCAMAIAHLQRFTDPPKAAYEVIDSILPGPDVEGMSLLGYTAAFQLMEYLYWHNIAREACSRSLERLAGGLRRWVGSKAADRVGFEVGMREKMVGRCAGVLRAVVGMDIDPGYGSMDDCSEGTDGGC